MGPRKWALLTLHEVRLEVRRKDGGTLMAAVGLLEVLLAGFSFQGGISASAAAGILWMGFLFAGILTVTRAFDRDRPNQALTGLYLAPGGRTAVLASKMTAGFAYVMVTEIVMTMLVSRMWGALPIDGVLLLVLALGGAGVVAAGTLMAAIGHASPDHDVLMPVLLMPLLVPVAIAAVRATQAVWAGGDPWLWIHGLIAYDAIFAALGLLLFDFLWEV